MRRPILARHRGGITDNTLWGASASGPRELLGRLCGAQRASPRNSCRRFSIPICAKSRASAARLRRLRRPTRAYDHLLMRARAFRFRSVRSRELSRRLSSSSPSHPYVRSSAIIDRLRRPASAHFATVTLAMHSDVVVRARQSSCERSDSRRTRARTDWRDTCISLAFKSRCCCTRALQPEFANVSVE